MKLGCGAADPDIEVNGIGNKDAGRRCFSFDAVVAIKQIYPRKISFLAVDASIVHHAENCIESAQCVIGLGV